MSAILTLLGLTESPEIPPGKESAVRSKMADYIRAGCPDPTLWASMSPLERNLMADAGDDVARERAVYVADAMVSRGSVLAPLDDGEAYVRENLQAALAGIAAEMQNAGA